MNRTERAIKRAQRAEENMYHELINGELNKGCPDGGTYLMKNKIRLKRNRNERIEFKKFVLSEHKNKQESARVA